MQNDDWACDVFGGYQLPVWDTMLSAIIPAINNHMTVATAAHVAPIKRQGFAAFQSCFSWRLMAPESHNAEKAKGRPMTGKKASTPKTRQRLEDRSILIFWAGISFMDWSWFEPGLPGMH